MKSYTFIVILVLVVLGIPALALAHCPLCTAGAGLAAIGAQWLGVGTAPIGIFIGAFAVAIGLWMSKLLKKEYVSYQKTILVLGSFALTVLPLLPLMPGLLPLYISLGGEYGSIMNRTYTINLFLLGSLVGGILLGISPQISRKITEMRGGKLIPFQGLALTFILLLGVALVLELWIS